MIAYCAAVDLAKSNGIFHLGIILDKGLSHRSTHCGFVENSPPVFSMMGKTINPVRFFMVRIITQFVQDIEENEQTAGDTDNHSSDID